MTDTLDVMDVARDHLIDEAMAACPDPVEAASCLLTAGFSVLIAGAGWMPARAALQGIVDTMVEDFGQTH